VNIHTHTHTCECTLTGIYIHQYEYTYAYIRTYIHTGTHRRTISGAFENDLVVKLIGEFFLKIRKCIFFRPVPVVY